MTNSGTNILEERTQYAISVHRTKTTQDRSMRRKARLNRCKVSSKHAAVVPRHRVCKSVQYITAGRWYARWSSSSRLTDWTCLLAGYAFVVCPLLSRWPLTSCPPGVPIASRRHSLLITATFSFSHPPGNGSYREGQMFYCCFFFFLLLLFDDLCQPSRLPLDGFSRYDCR